MPIQRSLVTVIRDMVQQEVRFAIQSLLGSVSRTNPKAKNGRRRRGPGPSRRGSGTWLRSAAGVLSVPLPARGGLRAARVLRGLGRGVGPSLP